MGELGRISSGSEAIGGFPASGACFLSHGKFLTESGYQTEFTLERDM